MLGTFSAPPPGAPYETTSPLTDEARLTMAQQANQHERELAPLKFALSKAVAAAAGAPEPSGHTLATPTPLVVPGASTSLEKSGTGSGPEPGTGPDPLAPGLTDQPTVPQPARSNTDSPSRGQPKPILDPHKQITGGWGPEAGGFEPQYFALDGTELLALIRHIWKDLDRQLGMDLRFGIAACYPQVLARVTVEVCGAHASASINDVAFTKESMVLSLQGVKVDDPQTPADALRVDAGLSRPYKHTIQTASGTLIVDRDTDYSEADAPNSPLRGATCNPDA